MKSRRLLFWGIGGLAAGTLVVALAVGFQMRRNYERSVASRVWPSVTPVVEPTVSGDGPPTVLLLGDSRIGQWDLRGASGARYVNAGISGGTSAEVLNSASPLLEKFRPDLVVIEVGINDLKLLGLRPDLRAVVTARLRDNLSALIRLCRQRGCRVLVLPVWPPTEPEILRRFVWNPAVPEAVREVNRALPALVAEDPGATTADFFAEGVTPGYLDTLHLTPETYRALTPLLERHVDELTKRP